MPSNMKKETTTTSEKKAKLEKVAVGDGLNLIYEWVKTCQLNRADYRDLTLYLLARLLKGEP